MPPAAQNVDLAWSPQHGALRRAYALLGDNLHPPMAELNERLAA